MFKLTKTQMAISCAFAVSVSAAVALPTIVHAVNGKKLIAVSLNRQENWQWAFDRAAMEAEAARQGFNIAFQFVNSDASKQSAQFENLLSLNPSALIILPADRRAASAIVETAHVLVIAYDGGISSAKVDYYATRYNYDVAVKQVRAALAFSPNGSYAIFNGDAGFEVAQAYGRSYDDALQANSSAKVVFKQFAPNRSPTAAQAVAENVMSANDDNIRS
jgi:ABC-type sugar transport system substrate-binding protein